jgi:putative acetyltransferase
MRTARQHLRKGVAAQMLEHIIQQAKTLGLERLSLETGSQTFFQKGHCTIQNIWI